MEESAAVADAADPVQIWGDNPADILLGGAAIFADRGAGRGSQFVFSIIRGDTVHNR